MDRAPLDAEDEARAAIAALDPPVELRRLRVREAGGAHFADVVIGVAPGAAVGQGHAAADRVEAALHDRLPEVDVVVHVEPRDGEAASASGRSRPRSASRTCARSTTSRCSTSTGGSRSRST